MPVQNRDTLIEMRRGRSYEREGSSELAGKEKSQQQAGKKNLQEQAYGGGCYGESEEEEGSLNWMPVEFRRTGGRKKEEGEEEVRLDELLPSLTRLPV